MREDARAGRCCAADRTCPTGGATTSTTRSPARWRWARSRPGTSPAWPGPWAARLPGIGRLLADGTLTKAKAKLIAATFEPLSEDEATRAEALILGELKGKTWFQVERLAWRAALAVAPDVAERRRAEAEKRRARVTIFREESGAVGLSGRDLPAAQALSGHANVLARAEAYERSGAFPDHTGSALQALAYLHLLNDVSAEDAIAFARTGDAQPPDDTPPDEDDDGD